MLFKRKKNVEIHDTHGKVDSVKNKVSEAFILFQQAHDVLDEADTQLVKAIEESEVKISELTAQLDEETDAKNRAHKELDEHKRLKEQLKPFLS